MNGHLSNQTVERFHSEALTKGDRTEMYNHILRCEPCRKLVVTPETEAVAVAALTDHLLPQMGDDPYHLDAATIEAFVDDKLDLFDRSTARLHLEDCAECSDEVTDFRESLATMRAVARDSESRRVEVVAPRRAFVFAMPMRIAAMIAVIAFAALALLAVWRWKSSAPTNAPGIDTRAGSQPTPLASPVVPSLAPSPSTLNPPKLAENLPGRSGTETPTHSVALKDGSNEISIDQAGNVVGLPLLPAESRQAVKNALTGEALLRPNVLDDVAVADASTRGGTGNEERIRIVSPTRTVVWQDKPILRWKSSKSAEGYRIEIADSNFRQVAKSDDLPASSQAWTSAVALKRGQVYTWTIRAVNKEGNLSEVASQGKFKILPEGRLRELNQLKGRRSHLALGLFYAREGMISESEREFGILVKDNPDSALAKKLLSEVRAWRPR